MRFTSRASNRHGGRLAALAAVVLAAVVPLLTPSSSHSAAAGLTAPLPAEPGYWLVASDGGVFSYGSARFFGLHRRHPPQPAHRWDGADGTGAGYWMVASDGGMFSYGDASVLRVDGGHRG